MRQSGIWISAMVGHDEERIIDTAAADASEEWARLRERDAMPHDTVLLVVHPALHRRLVDTVAVMSGPTLLYDGDANGRAIAAGLITRMCDKDPGLRQRLRW